MFYQPIPIFKSEREDPDATHTLLGELVTMFIPTNAMRTPAIASRILPVLLFLPAGPVNAQFEPLQTTVQVDPSRLSGSWSGRHHEDGPNTVEVVPGDYMGLPLNDEARARADAWQNTYQEMPERQCIPYTSHWLVAGGGGPDGVYMWAERDPIDRIVAWKLSSFFGTRTIWMDGRPHPSPFARHTALGFSTGRWIGDVLHVRTTHLTEGVARVSGVPSSTQAIISEYIVRHGDMLSLTMILYDPLYLEEPYILTKTYVSNPTVRVVIERCEPALEIPRPAGEIPHYLPGTNPHLTEMTEQFGIPLEAVRGGAATLYPEFRKEIEDRYMPPAAPPEWLLRFRREFGPR